MQGRLPAVPFVEPEGDLILQRHRSGPRAQRCVPYDSSGEDSRSRPYEAL